MSFGSDGWAFVEGEWVYNAGGGWYYYQGDCSSGTRERYLYINTSTGWAWGDINCNQNGANYCSSLILSCKESDWSNSTSPLICPSTGYQNLSWNRVGTCSGGITHPNSEIIPCIYVANAIACINFTYSNWTACSESNTLSRTIVSRIPSGCTGGNPVTLDICNYHIDINNTFINVSITNNSEDNPVINIVKPSPNPPINPENYSINEEPIVILPQKEKPGTIKTFFIKLICRISNLFSSAGYEECKIEYLSQKY